MAPKKANNKFRGRHDQLELAIQSYLQYKSQQQYLRDSCKRARSNHHINSSSIKVQLAIKNF